MRDEEIKQLLENVEVTPSAHCWEAIEGNLAAASGAAGTAATATKVAGHALSTAAKVIIGAVGAAAIATTAVILSLSKSDTVVPTPAQQNIENRIVLSDSVHTDDLVAEVTEVTEEPQPAGIKGAPATSRPSEAAANGSPAAATDDLPTSSVPAPKVAETIVTPAPATPPAPQATASTAPAKPSAATSTPKTDPKPAKENKPAQTSPLTDLSDPVLEEAENLSNINFTPPVTLVIPNIITPNGDGYNDVFIIKGIDQTERNRLIIRNSSGTIVFQTVNYKNDWGAPNLPDGTYFYQFVYTLHGIDETRTGTLTIMR